MSANTRHLEDILKGVAPPDPDPDVVMESLGPCVWCFVKPTYALDVEDGPKPVESFGYVYLGVRSVCTPDSFIVQFKDGDECWKVTVTGRNLRPVFDRVMEHRVRRIRKLDRDFRAVDDKTPCITGIDVQLVKESD